MKVKRYQGKTKKQSKFSLKYLPWFICILSAIFYCYDFLLRVAPSVMIHDLMRAYGVFAAEIGFLSAFYYYAYTPMQIPAGLILDRYRPRIVLTIAVGLCALGAFISAAIPNLYVGFIGRALMGFGSAFAFVGTLKLAAIWLPPERFGFMAGLTTGLGTLGAMIADIVLSRMVTHLGWQQALYVSGGVGVVLTLLIWLFVHGQNPRRKILQQEYKDWSHAWKKLGFIVRNWRFWINGIVGCFLFMPVSVFASLWGVAFLRYGYHLSQHDAATSTSLVFLGVAVGGPLAGYISDWLKQRRMPLIVGNLITILILFAIIYATFIPKLLLFALLFLLGMISSVEVLVFAIGKEISPPRMTGTATATTNFIVTIGAAVFQPLVGYVLDLFWDGTIKDGVPIYSVYAYQLALTLLPIVLIIGFGLTFFIPETHCRVLLKK